MQISMSSDFQNDEVLQAIRLRAPTIDIVTDANKQLQELAILFEPSKRDQAFKLVQHLQANHQCTWDLQTHIQQPDRFLLTCPRKNNIMARIQKVADRLEASAWRCRWQLD
jgi:hypothetical protein